jgi:galactose mutarotase-like enzyme
VYSPNTGAPASSEPVAGAHDLREIGEMVDGTHATWPINADPAVRLWWPEARLGATMRSDAATLHIAAALPSDVGALAVEPQTHSPQGLRRLLNGEPGAMAWLEPGASLSQTIEMTFTQQSSPTEGMT